MHDGTDDLRGHWTLDPSVTFLNHGSFGACPRAVLAEQQVWRDRLERQPVRFFVRDLESQMTTARGELAQFVGADPDDLAVVSNATTGVNAVLRSLTFEPTDELLTTDHAYGACKNSLDFVAARAGARSVVAAIPFPVAGPDVVVDAILARVTDRTRLALLSHVSSPTGLVFPIERLVAELQERGVDVLVDGAHAPGMVPLDIEQIGAAFYTGNCHKWICAPKGAAFLHVRRDRQDGIHPLVISHGAALPIPARSRFQLEFDWVGTDDPTAFLSVPAALRLLGSLVPGGWDEVRARNRALACEGRKLLCDALDIAPPCPEEMLGSLAALPIADGDGTAPTWVLGTDPLQDELLLKHDIEVPILPWPARPKRLVRVSAQLYNRIDDYAQLARALGARLP